MTTSPFARAAASADADFAGAMSVPEALLLLRDELPQKQWPSRDIALSRSVVVLTVAAWQAWVETYVVSALLALAEPEPDRPDHVGPRQLLPAGHPLLELALEKVKSFSTPDAARVVQLLRLVGDDPRDRWTFESVGGSRDRADVAGRLNDWVQVRHAIAHGARHLPVVGVLGTTRAGHGSLTHRHAARCVTFFRQLALVTGSEAGVSESE